MTGRKWVKVILLDKLSTQTYFDLKIDIGKRVYAFIIPECFPHFHIREKCVRLL